MATSIKKNATPRSANFTPGDKALLADLVQEFSGIICCKQTGAVMNKVLTGFLVYTFTIN